MRPLLFSAGWLAITCVAQYSETPQQDLLQDLQNRAIEALKSSATNGTNDCSLSTAFKRKDWEAMSATERKAYISAVQCLISSPSKSDPAKVPGARTRYDDFVGQHINQTLSIHGTGNFLSWHRYYVYAYEKALREECNYAGYQPYWNWFSYQNELTKSPVFDGSDTSMSGDGYFVEHNGTIAGAGAIFLPSGKGGGCIKDGPFKNFQLNLGPVAPTMDGDIASPGPLAYNPHCAKRDLTTYASSTWLTLTNLHNLTLGPASTSLLLFQNELQGRFTDGFLGMHAAGHYVMGGDASDFFSSPNDPVFFMHHAMLDRVWWIWQALHPELARTVAGTLTIFNNPPSRNATVEDGVGFEYLGVGEKRIAEVLDTLGGGVGCYIYE